MSPFPDFILELDWGPDTWYFYRAWAVMRATGRLPLHVFGGTGLPTSLELCPLCEGGCLVAEHLLCECPQTSDLYGNWWMATGHPGPAVPRLPWSQLRMELFAGRASFMEANPREGAHRILYVGTACKRIVIALREAVLSQDVDELIRSAEAYAEVPAGGGP